MPKFVFAYHGGRKPDSPAEFDRVMGAWNSWYSSLGSAIVDGGGPVGVSKTVTSGGVKGDGGANPLSGYTLVEAPDLDAAIAMAGGCPILEDGTVEVAEVMQM